jgi:hypothetical protein
MVNPPRKNLDQNPGNSGVMRRVLFSGGRGDVLPLLGQSCDELK